jgi:serine/alanine adding enzyme
MTRTVVAGQPPDAGPDVALEDPGYEVHTHPDVYFRPEYGRADSCLSGGQWLGLERCDGHFQVPLHLRPISGTLLDGVSPYGYSGVYASPELDADEICEAWRSVALELRERGVVSIFLRHSPLVPQAAPPLPHVTVVSDHPTVGMAVSSPDQAWAEMSGSSRNKVRKARNLGFHVEISPARREDLRAGSHFRQLYEETMRRRHASAFYFFPDEYYERLATGLGSAVLLARGFDADGSVRSAALFLHHGDLVHYHLAGSDPAAARAGLNNLLIWTVAEHAAALGVSRLHLGGGRKPGDDLEAFKASFSRHRYSFQATGVVIDPRAYTELVRRRRVKEADTGFFPAYRAGADE